MNYRVPLYIQLKEMILQRISDGEYLPGEKIPSEREMASIYKINRMTVKNAINALVEEGILYKVKNEGTFVTREKTKNILYLNDMTSKSKGLGALITASGMQLENVVLERSVVTNRSYLEHKLNLEPGANIYALHRLRHIGGESIALEHSYVPLTYFNDIHDHNFERASLYAYMESKGHLPVKFLQQMTVQKAARPVDKIMKISADDYLYVLEYIGQDNEGNVVEFTTSYMRCDKAVYNFEIREE